MLKIDFTEESIKKLNAERYNHPHPRVRLKMSVLYLKSQGISHKDIKRIEGICEQTLLDYIREYMSGGTERLKEIRFRRRDSELSPYAEEITEYFRNNPPASVNEAAKKIEELTKIKKSNEAVRVFLKKLGFNPRKVGMIPAKADIREQEKFLSDTLKPLAEEARSGRRTLFLQTRRILF